MKIHKYIEFIKENLSNSNGYYLPTYEECVEMCSQEEATFYETKLMVDNFPVSVFNYRLAIYNNFINPIASKPNIQAKEMRGLCFVFNTDGSVYNRYILLEKFFNLNQVPESMYSIVKDYKIKYINLKEDGSIASFIKLPNGKIVGKSKMGFDNDQANGINRVYRTNQEIKKFVDWTLSNDISAIFEYCSPSNRIVIKYPKEELILLRMRCNLTGKHLDLKNYLDKIGTIKIAPFSDDTKTLDNLIELVATEVDKEGYVIHAEDKNGNDFLFKMKTPWYMALHGLLSEDLYREHVLIGYILDDKIDDILGQIPEDEKEAHERIGKIISVVKRSLSDKVNEIQKFYDFYISSKMSIKDFAISHKNNKNFGYAMSMIKADRLRKMTTDEISNIYPETGKYERELEKCDVHELAKCYIRDNTKRLNIAREWLKSKDPSIFFKDVEESEDEN